MIQLIAHGTGRQLLARVKEYAEREREIVALDGEISAAVELRRKVQKRTIAAIDALDGAFDKVDKSQAVIDAIEAAKEARDKAELDLTEWQKLYKGVVQKKYSYTTAPAEREQINSEIKKLESEKPIAPEDIKIPDMPKPLDRAEREKLITKLSCAVETVGDLSNAAAHVAELIARRDELTAKIAEDEKEIAVEVERFRHLAEVEKNLAGL